MKCLGDKAGHYGLKYSDLNDFQTQAISGYAAALDFNEVVRRFDIVGDGQREIVPLVVFRKPNGTGTNNLKIF